MANSLNGLAKNAENLNSTYDNGSTPSSDDSLDDIATELGFGASVPSAEEVPTGVALGGNMARFAQYNTEWEGFRAQQNIGGTDEQDAPSNQFIALGTYDFDCLAYRDDTKIYKNGTLSTTINAGDGGSVGCVQGDRIYVSRPVGQSSGTEFDEGFLYLGWAGFTFAHRRDRNSGATLFIYNLSADTTYELRYTTSDGVVSSTTLQSTSTVSSAGTLTNVGSLLSTRNYVLFATKPICAYVRLISGGGVNDSLPLYPLDQDAKFGAFSAGGHIFQLNNYQQYRAASNVTQTLFTRSSNGSSTTERNASTAYGSMYIDLAPGQTSGTFFSGPVQKIQSSSSSLIGAEQQADGNGSEMTPFVSKKAFGSIGSTTAGTPAWVCLIGESAMTIYHRNTKGQLKSTTTMAGSATYSLYFKYFNSNLSNDDIFESTNGSFIMYYDSNTTLDDERTCYMGDVNFEVSSLYATANMSGPYGDPSEACNSPTTASTHYVIITFQNGEQVFTNSACTSELSIGSNYYYNHDTNQTFQYTPWTPSSGGIENIQNCGR